MKFYLSEIKSKKDLKKLFIEKWNWENPKIYDSFFDFSNVIKNKIIICTVLCERLNYKIFFFNLGLKNPEKELKTIERKIINEPALKKFIENSIFIFSAKNFQYLDFVKAEKISARFRIKRFSISPENRDKLRTSSEQLEKLKLDPEKLSPSWIRNRVEEAFSVETVTEKFYKEYIELFEKIKKGLTKQEVKIYGEKKEEKLRGFIHQTLNRIMFLYFVQKRRCFGNDQNFLANFWDAYKNQFRGENKFHKNWLEVLFFEALSQPLWLYKEKSYLKEFNKILKEAPYLNGGLFEKNELDDIGWQIPDILFDDIFEFFESYNFTIEESTPFEIEIAINPEMLGNIYEQLVNVEEREEQAKAGIFYTPRLEIELMIRRSLVEFLFNKTKINKEKLYKFVFPKAEKEIEYPFTLDETRKVLKELDEIFILDPACGSGHYLVVATQILYELKEILWEELNIKHLDKYEEKKKIIERNIYGNDIKEWAVNVAKLRLWLDLFVDAKKEILENQTDPLLPSLSFRIRHGDSLIQKIGAELSPLRKISSTLKYEAFQLKELQRKKLAVYENKLDSKTVVHLEKNLLGKVLFRLHHETFENIKKKKREIEAEKHPHTLFEKEKIQQIDKKKLKKLREELKILERELKEIEKFRKELSKLKEPPMIWDLAFAEVFVNKNGFDIVIANPPYVRQEKIEDLNGFYSKKEYKEKLIEQTKLDWSYNFQGKPVISPIPKKFDRKCDLYVYFYLKGLKLLNPEGILCYISSNSWLDVGYGRTLQQVLLKRVPISAIYDNQAKRSFKHADVNVIIALLKAPRIRDFDKEIKNNEVNFVMFKKPFEEIMDSEIFIDLEKEKGFKEYPEGKRRETEIFRIHKVNQKDLYEFGRDKKTGEYTENKWGGKYLRAPEIYWIILKKGQGKLVRLGDIAEVRFGIKTGANDFFYLPSKYFDLKEEEGHYKLIPKQKGLPNDIKIEKEFLKPVIKSPRECKTIMINPEDLKYKVFMCHKLREELKGTRALKYIEWGENQKFHKRPTCKSRKNWWDLVERNGFILWSRVHDDKHRIFYNRSQISVADTFSEIESKVNPSLVCAILNSYFICLEKELLGRISFGEGALGSLEIDIIQLLVPHPQKINKDNAKRLLEVFENLLIRPIKSIFEESGISPKKPIQDQEPNPLPDRKALDDIVFDALGLTEEERKEVYWAVAELVKNRLEKAKSM